MHRKALIRMTVAAAFIAVTVWSCGGGGGGGGGTTTLPPPPPPPSGGPTNFASRTDGVAPLGVFFDAVSTGDPSFDSGVVQPANGDYGSFRYVWDYGDPNSGTWATSGRSRNSDSGYTAAHIYEDPGTYTATLTVTDALGMDHVYSQVITVTGFSGTTYYVSSGGGNDSNDGLTPLTPWQTFGKAISQAAPNRRFLFNRGETFVTNNESYISQSGPGIIGAYGSGDRPIIQSTGGGATLQLSGSDWRVMDLEFSGPGQNSTFGLGLIAHFQMTKATFLRIKSHDYYGAIGWSDWHTIFQTPHQEIIVADCELTNNYMYCVFAGGRRIAFIGNAAGTVIGQGHVVRLWQAEKAVVAHNSLWDGWHHAIKLHGPAEGDVRLKTRFVHISDNRLLGGIWVVAVGPQNTSYDERVSQVVFERNLFLTEADTQVGLKIYAQDVTIRNNIFNGTGVNWFNGVSVEDGGAVPAAIRVQILNNTFYKGDGGQGLMAINIDDEVSYVTIRNNLASSPGSGIDYMINGSCPNMVAENNLLTDSAGFTNAGAGDFTLTNSSPARNAGLTLIEVLDDYTLTTRRPQGAAFDLGVYERD